MKNKKHPEQHIQEEWMKMIAQESLTYGKYIKFIKWMEEYKKSKSNPID